jgi:hypothetical protein
VRLREDFEREPSALKAEPQEQVRGLDGHGTAFGGECTRPTDDVLKVGGETIQKGHRVEKSEARNPKFETRFKIQISEI